MNAAPRRDNAGLQPGEVPHQSTQQQPELSDSHPAPVKTYPTHGTQPARLLAALLYGSAINPLGGWRSLGIYRLSDTVFQLRGMGWPVQTDRLNVSNRFKESCYVAQYMLPAHAINDADQTGQDFAGREFAMMREAA